MSEVKEFKVDDFACYIWGYGQTNVDWFRVVKKSDKSVWFEEVKSERVYKGDMHGETSPTGESKGLPVFRRSLRQIRDTEVTANTHGNIYPWGGKPRFFSEWH
jgi:hypothetical protein